MRRISACSHRSAERLIRQAGTCSPAKRRLFSSPCDAAKGFTLLELLVVLAMVAVLVAMVAPAGWRALESARTRAAHRSLTALLESLPMEARRSGAALQRDATGLLSELREWPETWTLFLPMPLQYSADGVARGGELEIRQGKRAVSKIVVAPITGTPSLEVRP